MIFLYEERQMHQTVFDLYKHEVLDALKKGEHSQANSAKNSICTYCSKVPQLWLQALQFFAGIPRTEEDQALWTTIMSEVQYRYPLVEVIEVRNEASRFNEAF